jgi:hypothetical protein
VLGIDRAGGRCDLGESGALRGENERVGWEEMALGGLGSVGVVHIQQMGWDRLEWLRLIVNVWLELGRQGRHVDRREDRGRWDYGAQRVQQPGTNNVNMCATVK